MTGDKGEDKKVSPVVIGAGLFLRINITVTARGVDRAARVGQVVGRVSYTHLAR